MNKDLLVLPPATGPLPARKFSSRGVVVALAAILLFALFTWAMRAGLMAEMDLGVANGLKTHADESAILRSLFIVVTHIGGVPALTGLALIGLAVLLWKRLWVLALGWAIAAGGGALLNVGIKDIIDRERPPLDMRDPGIHETNESYPSGHAMGSVIGLGILAYMLVPLVPARRRALLFAGTAVLVVLIGFSRVYLRAHWTSDVLAGFALGTAWLTMCITSLEAARARVPKV